MTMNSVSEAIGRGTVGVLNSVAATSEVDKKLNDLEARLKASRSVSYRETSTRDMFRWYIADARRTAESYNRKGCRVACTTMQRLQKYEKAVASIDNGTPKVAVMVMLGNA